MCIFCIRRRVHSIKTLFRTADLMYAIPFYRMTIYVLGILLGYVLRTYKNQRLTGVSGADDADAIHACFVV